MLKKIFGVAIILFGAAVFAFGQEEKSNQINKDETAVRQIVEQLQDGWNTHDGKAFAAPFAADADYVVVNGMYIKGREAIEKGHTQIFTTIYKDSKNIATIQNIRFLRKDVAVVHVEWNLEFRIGGKTNKAHGLTTMIMTKDAGKWSITAFQNTPIQPVPQGEN